MTHGEILTELARVKAVFQLRALATVMGIPARGMSASGQDPQGLEAKPASPAPSGRAQPLSSSPSEIHHG
jgi:hypothetical protein